MALSELGRLLVSSFTEASGLWVLGMKGLETVLVVFLGLLGGVEAAREEL